MSIKRANSWFKKLREENEIVKTIKDHIIHTEVFSKETGELRYERWRVRYANKILKTDLVFENKADAIKYNEECKELIRRKRIENGALVDVKDIAEYPENLLKKLEITFNNIDYKEIVDNFETNFELACEEVLTPREKIIICERYRCYKTLEEIGKELNVTRERVRQIESKALRKLGTRKNIILNKKNKYDKIRQLEENEIRAKLKAEMSYEVALEIIKEHAIENNMNVETLVSGVDRDDLIDNLNLSVRSYNGLKRAGIDTISQIKKLSYPEIANIRNLGKKSANEIVDKLKDYCNYKVSTTLTDILSE